MKMTKIDALNIALSIMTEDNQYDEAVEILQKMVMQLSKPRTTSDEAKAKASAKRKEQTAKARMELCAQVIPILREVITTNMTAKEIFEAARERLPKDFTAPKVQNILLREMAPELIKTETKGKANTYCLK